QSLCCQSAVCKAALARANVNARVEAQVTLSRRTETEKDVRREPNEDPAKSAFVACVGVPVRLCWFRPSDRERDAERCDDRDEPDNQRERLWDVARAEQHYHVCRRAELASGDGHVLEQHADRGDGATVSGQRQCGGDGGGACQQRGQSDGDAAGQQRDAGVSGGRDSGHHQWERVRQQRTSGIKHGELQRDSGGDDELEQHDDCGGGGPWGGGGGGGGGGGRGGGARGGG